MIARFETCSSRIMRRVSGRIAGRDLLQRFKEAALTLVGEALVDRYTLETVFPSLAFDPVVEVSPTGARPDRRLEVTVRPVVEGVPFALGNGKTRRSTRIGGSPAKLGRG
jgi:hypothetical protein